MSEHTVLLTAKMNGDEVHSNHNLDLSERSGRRYMFPQPLLDHDDSEVEIILQSKNQKQLSINIESESASSENKGSTKASLYINERAAAKSGVRKESMTITCGSMEADFIVYTAHDSENLGRKQYDMMVEDISHWIFTSIDKKTVQGVDSGYRDGDSDINSYILMEIITDKFSKITNNINRILTKPSKKTRKEYYGKKRYLPRKDRKCIVKDIADPVHNYSYKSVTRYDTEENILLLGILENMKTVLSFVMPSAKREFRARKRNHRRNKMLYENGKKVKKYEVVNAKKNKERAKKIKDRIDKIKVNIEKYIESSFLSRISIPSGNLSVSDYGSLVDDPKYAQLLSIWREIQNIKNIKRITDISNKVDSIVEVGVKKNSTIYEIWSLFSVVQGFISCGFEFKNGCNFENFIDTSTLIPQVLSESSTTLHETNSQEKVEIRIKYEEEVWFTKPRRPDDNPDKCPDITVDVLEDGEVDQKLILDAKYRDIDNSNGDWKGQKEIVKDDYQKPSRGGVIPKSCGAFLLHTGSVDEKVESGNKWYGAIPLKPGQSGILKNFISDNFLPRKLGIVT